MDRYIPRFLNAQPQFLWWEMDEFMILITSVLVGNFIEKMLICFALSFLFVRFYRKLKNDKQQGFFNHTMYYLGVKKWKTNAKYHGETIEKVPFFYIKNYIR